MRELAHEWVETHTALFLLIVTMTLGVDGCQRFLSTMTSYSTMMMTCWTILRLPPIAHHYLFGRSLLLVTNGLPSNPGPLLLLLIPLPSSPPLVALFRMQYRIEHIRHVRLLQPLLLIASSDIAVVGVAAPDAEE